MHTCREGNVFGKRCSILKGFSRRVDRRVEVFGMSLQKRLEIRTVSPCLFRYSPIFICNFTQAAAAVLITHFKVLPSVPCLCVKNYEIRVVHPRCVASCLVQGIVRSKIKIQSSLTICCPNISFLCPAEALE